MNKENAAQYLPLVKALAEGKQLQINPYGEQWIDTNSNIDFVHSPSFYRIKPERKTITGFVNVYPETFEPMLYLTKEKAHSNAAGSPRRIACVPVTITYEEGEGL